MPTKLKKSLSVLLTLFLLLGVLGTAALAVDGFTQLPTADSDDLADGAYWYDVEGFVALAMTQGMDELNAGFYRSATYYLSDDTNTLRVVMRNESSQDFERSNPAFAPYFDFLKQHEAGAPAFAVGDLVTFGSYPQSRVTDETLINALNAQTLNWTYYDYYVNNEHDDFMKYADVTYNRNRYRAVTFSHYRPFYATSASTGANQTFQDENGYVPDTVYWFRYEPIVWRILDADAGLMMTESILDTQAFNNRYYESGGEYYGDANFEHYASDWANSSLRAWMNGDFLNAAFDSGDQSYIKNTSLVTPSSSDSAYDADPTTDQIFLLSKDDALNTAYGFDSVVAKTAFGTDYAKCQGLDVFDSADQYYSGASDWILRTPCYSDKISYVYLNGYIYNDYYDTYITNRGIRAALNINNLQSALSQSVVKIYHEYGALIPEIPATCTEDGAIAHYECSICGAYFDAEKNPVDDIAIPAGHTYGEADWTDATFADCGNDGTVGYFTCTVCGERFDAEGNLLTDQDIVISATGDHDWEWVTDEEPGCYTDGVQHQYCSVCEHIQNEGTPIPAAHEFDPWVDASAPTCGRDGNVGYQHCHVCGDDFDADGNKLDSIVDPATGLHDWEWVTDTAPTCVDTGVQHQKCTVCGAEQAEGTVMEATGDHTYGEEDWTDQVSADCGNDGNIGYFTCTVCGQRFDAEGTLLTNEDIVISATGDHDWEWVTDEEPGCYTDGVQHQYCSVCEHIQNEGTPIPAAHEFDPWVDAVAPDCGNDGNVGYQHCHVCGDNFDADGVRLDTIVDPATGLHDWEWVTDTAADCGNNGEKHQKCTVCNATQAEGTVIEATGEHDYEGVEWTYYDAGQHVRNCAVCGRPEYEDHDVIVRGDGPATCGAEGYTGDEYCSVCGQKLSGGTVIPPTGNHTFGTTGDARFTCTGCGHVDDERKAAAEAADQLAADKAAFNAYKTAAKAAAGEKYEDGDSAACRRLILNAKNAIDALAYDESKTPDENKAAVDAVLAKLDTDLAARREADAAAAEQQGQEEGPCPLCGDKHGTSTLGRLIRVIHRFIALIKDVYGLFGKVAA